MDTKPEIIVYKWLRKLKIGISFSFLRDKFLSHPYYPSLLSITDTLEELGIESYAMQIEKIKLDKISMPFLVHDFIKSEFVLITNGKEQLKPGTELEKNWNGTILLAEASPEWHHKDNTIRRKKEKSFLRKIVIITSLLLTAPVLSGLLYWPVAGFYFSSLFGLFISILIIQKEMGLRNHFTDRICHLGSNTDCMAVIKSNKGKIFQWLNWGDVGIIYFSSVLVLSLSFLMNNNSAGGIYALVTLGLSVFPFSFFSIYYQWRVIKKWCPLCLFIIIALIIQFIIALPLANSLLNNGLNALIVSGAFFFSACIISVNSVVWLLVIKPIIGKVEELDNKNHSLMRFKRNPEVFNSFLSAQRKVDTKPFEKDLQLGNPESPIQVIMASNPYCQPCAKAHELLARLVRKGKIGLTIRFAIETENTTNKGTAAVMGILSGLAGNTPDNMELILAEWYKSMDLDQFKSEFCFDQSANVSAAVKDHILWSKKSNVVATPTIFVNGYEVPGKYSVEDLSRILGGYEGKIQ